MMVGLPSFDGNWVSDVVKEEETGVVKGLCDAPFDFLA